MDELNVTEWVTVDVITITTPELREKPNKYDVFKRVLR